MANHAVFKDTPFHVGDTVRIHYRLIEKEKVSGKAKKEVKEETRERIQVFEGIVISIKGEQLNKSFTVRRMATGKIGVERIFPIISPWIKAVEVKESGAVRRAKLFYIRDRVGREAEKLSTAKKTKAKAKAKAKTVKAAQKGDAPKKKS